VIKINMRVQMEKKYRRDLRQVKMQERRIVEKYTRY
jgi:hypothetical protein